EAPMSSGPRGGLMRDSGNCNRPGSEQRDRRCGDDAQIVGEKELERQFAVLVEPSPSKPRDQTRRQAMTDHKTGTREEWLAARRDLLAAEKELTRRGDELARRRQELPWVRIDKDYRFETDEGPASLADLFRGRSQLLVYHFMFGPEYTAG